LKGISHIISRLLKRIFISWIFILMLLAASIACNDRPPMTPAETTLHLLAVHGLLGKSPGDRSDKDKNTLVDADDLNELFVDLADYDKFTGELYTGVILGALAANQSKLEESRTEKSAQVTAGRMVIHLDLVNNLWKISLGKTIPDKLKERAIIEKQRYDAAKAAGEAMSNSM
jgi:hypothetical protein